MLHMYYCRFNDWFGDRKIYFFIPTLILMMALFLYLLSSTAESYLTPAVESIVELFNINESLAAVTVLAFGNGAIEVFSAMSNAEVSAQIGDTSMSQPLSSLLGGYMFAISMNIFLSLHAASGKEIQLNKAFFSRDMFFMMGIQTYLLVIILFVGHIKLFQVFSFIGLYILYMIFVIWQSNRMRKLADLKEQHNIDVNADISISKKATVFLEAYKEVKYVPQKTGETKEVQLKK